MPIDPALFVAARGERILNESSEHTAGKVFGGPLPAERRHALLRSLFPQKRGDTEPAGDAQMEGSGVYETHTTPFSAAMGRIYRAAREADETREARTMNPVRKRSEWLKSMEEAPAWQSYYKARLQRRFPRLDISESYDGVTAFIAGRWLSFSWDLGVDSISKMLLSMYRSPGFFFLIHPEPVLQ